MVELLGNDLANSYQHSLCSLCSFQQLSLGFNLGKTMAAISIFGYDMYCLCPNILVE